MKAGWSTVPMAELCSIQSGKSDTKDAVPDGPYAFFDRSKTIKRSTRFLRDCEALIIPGEGAEFLPRYFNGKFDLHQRAYALFNFSPKLDVRFLFYYLHHTADYFPRVAVGATVKSLRLRHFEELPVAITSLPEQQRIVTLLDEAFNGIATAKANAEKNLQNARVLFNIALSDELNHHRDAGAIVQLGRVCGFENGDRGKNYPGKQHRVASGIPFINAGHLTEDGLDFMGMDYISKERFDLLGNGKIKPNDILFCLRGSLGKFANVGNLSQGAIASSLVILRPSERLLHEYLMIYLSSRLCAEMITTFKGGAAQPNLGAKDLKSFEIPVPTLALQQDTVSRLSDLKTEIRSLTEIYARKAAALDELKKSLLHCAFNGDL